jgi:hypothetical protein
MEAGECPECDDNMAECFGRCTACGDTSLSRVLPMSFTIEERFGRQYLWRGRRVNIESHMYKDLI